MINNQIRKQFDTLLDEVVAQLPPHILDLVNEVPLVVDDYPSPEVLKQTGIRYRGQLCGLYTGIPLTERSVWQSGTLPDRIMIYREGILNMAADRSGHITPERLREQIRITVLHEIGHHHGLTEDDLVELGYG